MVVNALLDIWTLEFESRGILRLGWIPDTPVSVKRAVEGGRQFLIGKAEGLPRKNAFFSGTHDIDSLALFFISNQKKS